MSVTGMATGIGAYCVMVIVSDVNRLFRDKKLDAILSALAQRQASINRLSFRKSENNFG